MSMSNTGQREQQSDHDASGEGAQKRGVACTQDTSRRVPRIKVRSHHAPQYALNNALLAQVTSPSLKQQAHSAAVLQLSMVSSSSYPVSNQHPSRSSSIFDEQDEHSGSAKQSPASSWHAKMLEAASASSQPHSTPNSLFEG